MFFEYGDDSVAQLGGVHLACEQASNLLTKILEWGRLMAYLEQSTRYIPYDSRLHGRYRYCRPSEVCESPLGMRYVADLDGLFDTYSALLDADGWTGRASGTRRNPSDSDFVYKQTIKAKACDAVRGVLPAATISNVGIYGTGQALRSAAAADARAPVARGRVLRASSCSRSCARSSRRSSSRVDRPDRGGAWTAYLAKTRDDTADLVARIFARRRARAAPADVTLLDWDPEGEDKVLAAICYPHTNLPEAPAARSGPPAAGRRPHRVGARVRRRPHQPPPQARTRVRAHRLPLRRARRLRRVPRPAAAPDAHDRMAALSPASRIRRSRARASKRDSTRASTTRWNGRPRSTTCWPSGSPSRPRTRCRSRTGCVT